jgi:hypothetical protein
MTGSTMRMKSFCLIVLAAFVALALARAETQGRRQIAATNVKVKVKGSSESSILHRSLFVLADLGEHRFRLFQFLRASAVQFSRSLAGVPAVPHP